MFYTIRHEENLVGHYTVEADSPEEAVEKFQNEIRNGFGYDLSDMEMLWSNDTVINEEETK